MCVGVLACWFLKVLLKFGKFFRCGVGFVLCWFCVGGKGFQALWFKLGFRPLDVQLQAFGWFFRGLGGFSLGRLDFEA